MSKMATNADTTIATGGFPLDPRVYAKTPTPTLDDYERLWAIWICKRRVTIHLGS